MVESVDAYGSEGGQPSAGGRLTAADYDVLAHERRRHVLDCLAGRDALMTVRDLAEAVAGRERDTTRDDVSPDELKRVYVTLHHAHIPIMADAGVVEYDRARQTVQLAPGADRLLRVRSSLHA